MVALWNCYILLSILYIVCVLYYIRNVCVRLCLAYQFFIRQNLPNQVWMEEDLNIGQRILLLSCTTTIFVYVAFMYCALFTTGTVNIKTALHNIHLQLNFPTESHILWTKLTSWHWWFFFFLPYIYFFFPSIHWIVLCTFFSWFSTQDAQTTHKHITFISIQWNFAKQSQLDYLEIV